MLYPILDNMKKLRLFTGKVQHYPVGMSSAIAKSEVQSELWLGETGLEGDEQASTQYHGGSERALLHYPSTHYIWWQDRLPEQSERFRPAAFGENISASQWDEKNVHIGDIFHWGDAIIQVSQPRSPCYKLNLYLNIPGIAMTMQQHARCGWLYRVLKPGLVSPNMPFELAERISPVSVHETMRILFGDEKQAPNINPDEWQRLLSTEWLSESWQKTLQNRLDRGQIESWQARLEGSASH